MAAGFARITVSALAGRARFQMRRPRLSLALDAIRAIGMRRRDYLAALSSMKMNKAGTGRRRQSRDLAFSKPVK